MIFSIPILVEEHYWNTKVASFVVRPLLHGEPVERADSLSRALNKLTSQLTNMLTKLGREARHDTLVAWTFHPVFETNTLELSLELNCGYQKCQLFFAGYPALNRKLYFTPAAPNLHFEVLPNQTLAERATAVLTQHFRAQDKEGTFNLETLTSSDKSRLTTLEIEIDPATLVKGPKKPKRAMLFGSLEKKDGEEELRKTGRRLMYSYPDDLERAVHREREVAELARLLAGSDRRPIVLVGPRQVGKTAIIHELVWRICASGTEKFAGGCDVWLVSPMRLISGMSYLGEWENRVLAIFAYAQGKDKVLYFDDLLGLFTAGVSCASDLNVAQVLKPVLEKRNVRILAEITPEAWRVLRERDRAFADFFHVIPIAETTEAQTLHVMTSMVRLLEDSSGWPFALDVVPLGFDLFQRFGGDAAFPGKAAGFLKRLPMRAANTKPAYDEDGLANYCSEVRAGHVLVEFREQTGLNLAFLDDDTKLARLEIMKHLREEVLGQDQALEAFADVLVKLKARLNDPRRPLGTFLLLGPTGVGKTQAAKALAKFLFSQEDRLVRFDMNEYVDAAAAARITGTPSQPEGLLTGAIRRQPFSVLLFDEIEKAAPEVFDLLLAVLDEGRLTDALGRVADFTHSIIVLTSNLGAREARSRLGFGAATGEDQDEVFVSAAEKLFRPEFFNRLDRIIPFRALAPEQLAGIAQRLVRDVFAREGLRRRECLVQVFPSALEQLVKLGHHPQLGARALKRVVERELAQSLARRLAAVPSGTPTTATFAAQDGKFHLRLEPFRMAKRTVSWATEIEKTGVPEERRQLTEELAGNAEVFLARIGKALERSAPDSVIVQGRLSPEQERHAVRREQWFKVSRLAQAARHLVQPVTRDIGFVPAPKARYLSDKLQRNFVGHRPKYDIANDALRVELSEMKAHDPQTVTASLPSLLSEAVWLEVLMAHSIPGPGAPASGPARTSTDPPPAGPAAGAPQQPLTGETSFALVLRGLSELDKDALLWVAKLYRGGIASLLEAVHLEAGAVIERDLPPLISQETPAPAAAIWCQEGHLRHVLPAGESCILVRRADGTLGCILVSLCAARSVQGLPALLAEASEPAKAGGDVSVSLGPVIHSLHWQGAATEMTDLRSGMVLTASPTFDQVRAFLLSALPLPAEFRPRTAKKQ